MTPDTGRDRTRRDIAADINARIIADLERGVLPWKKPWNGDRAAGSPGLPLRATGEHYRGINIVLLWNAAADHGYRSPYWLTFQQCLKLGAFVRKGERGELVVYYGKTKKTRQNAAGEDVEDTIRFLKAYVVFNADQVDNLPATYHAPPPPLLLDPLSWHEDWFSKLEISRILTRDTACYIPGRDAIGMPPLAAFESAELYVQTLNHECGHATQAAHRLGRDFKPRYGDRAYYVEEITAELCAAYLGAHFGLPPAHLHDHASYIGHWVDLLKSDRRAFLDAAAKAQSAVDWLLAKSPMPASLQGGVDVTA